MNISAHLHYCGIDPGHKGAVAIINAAGTSLKVWKMPSADGDLQFEGLREIFRYLRNLPGTGVGLEFPTAFPGSFANVTRDAENFGRQKGVLESFAYLHTLPYYRISPVAWKGKLALDGKQVVGANAAAAALFDSLYPHHTGLIRGPRGGLLDGPLDALLIAHYMRHMSGSVASSAVKGSAEHFAAIMGAGPGKRKFCRMPRKL